jgi:acyl-CoA synthetase (AMP-forming)/AMP-acid ligase II
VVTTLDVAGSNAVHRFVLEPARADAGATLLIDAPTGGTSTRGDVADAVRRAAAALLERDLRPEQRILLVLADTPTFAAFFWGAMWIGAVPVPVSTMLTEADYRFLLEDSRAVGWRSRGGRDLPEVRARRR